MNKYILTDHEVLGILGQWQWARSGKIVHWLVAKFKPDTFVEVGSNTSHLCELLCRTYPKLKVFAVDRKFVRPNLPKKYPALTFVVGNSAESSGRFKNGTLGMVYIDASHDYESVKRDIAAWHPKLTPKGILCGHDYYAKQHPGTVRAIDEFCRSNGRKLNLEDYANWWVSPKV